MTDADLAKADVERQTLEEVQVESAPKVSIELLNKRSNKTTKLLDTSGETAPIEGRRRWFEYDFTELIYVFAIRIHTNKYASYHRFELEWVDQNGDKFSQRVDVNDNCAEMVLHTAIKSIRFRPPTSFVSNREIVSVSIWGVAKKGLNGLLNDLYRMQSTKESIIKEVDTALSSAKAAQEKIDAAESALADITERKNRAESELSSRQSELTKLTEERSLLNDTLNNLKAEIKESQSRRDEMDETISVRTKERQAVVEDISEKERELRRLKDNVNLFPSEIEGFANQSGKNIKLFTALALIPIAIIAVMFIILVVGAADLSTVLRRENNVDVWTITATRIPYVVVATAIIGACYKIARVFISEIMRISQQKLGLTKISIIASDVSRASEDGLEMSDEERFELRTHFKMELLRDHLKTYITKDFPKPLPRHLDVRRERPADLTLTIPEELLEDGREIDDHQAG